MPPKRADAQRNRDKILAAAREAFADPAAEVSMAEVARRAGVGMATLYRNFAGKRELLEALYVDEVDAVVEAAETLDLFDWVLAAREGHEAVHPADQVERLGRVDHGVDLVHVERLEQLPLAGEVAVQRGHPDARATRDLGHRDLRPRVGERLARGGEDLLAVALGVGARHWKRRAYPGAGDLCQRVAQKP